MSLQRDPIGPIPAKRLAHAAFPKGTLCMRLRDTVGTIYTDDVFIDLFSSTGRPAEAPWRLALVSILHYIEDLSDRQAVHDPSWTRLYCHQSQRTHDRNADIAR